MQKYGQLRAYAAALACVISIAGHRVATADWVGTAFTYQGELLESGEPVTAQLDMLFSLYDGPGEDADQVAAPVLKENVEILAGRFMATLDFGDVIDGSERWLQITLLLESSVQVLSPRQPLTPTPYALALPGLRTIQHADAPQVLGGSLSNSILGTSAGRVIGGGAGHQLAAGTPYSLIDGGLDNAMTLNSWYGVIGGGRDNVITGAGEELVNAYSTIAGGFSNTSYEDAGTIGGGRGNQVGIDDTFPGDSDGSTISGGINNHVRGKQSAIGGGFANQTWGSYSAIGGGRQNTAGNNFGTPLDAQSATVAGGRSNVASSPFSAVGGGHDNIVTGFGTPLDGSEASVIGGGRDNQIVDARIGTISGGGSYFIDDDKFPITIGGNFVFSDGGTVGGGAGNIAGDSPVANAWFATIGGGRENTASGIHSTVGGGIVNTASGPHTTVAGGIGNIASDQAAAIGGGFQNAASGWYSTVPGGFQNAAHGDYSFAAGRSAATSVSAHGTFVWNDNSGSNLTETAMNRVTMRAVNGFKFFTSAANGAILSPGATTWGTFSDERLKDDIAPIDSALDRVLSLHGVSFKFIDPEHFSYRPGEQTGFIAQEVERLFPHWVSEVDGFKVLSINGFEALAVEAMRELREEKDAEIAELHERIDHLEMLVLELTNRIQGDQR